MPCDPKTCLPCGIRGDYDNFSFPFTYDTRWPIGVQQKISTRAGPDFVDEADY
jgi:hypothetical protein